MEKVLKIYKEYFLLSHGLVLILFLINLLFELKSNNKEVIFLTIYLFLILTFFSVLEFVKYEVIRPKKIKSVLEESFIESIKINKQKIRNSYLLNIYDYDIIIEPEWERFQKKLNFNFRVLFDPLSLDRTISKEEYVRFNDAENHKYFFQLNCLVLSLNENQFNKLNKKSFMSEIKLMTELLVLKKLKPITYKNWILSYAKMEELESKYLDKIYS